MSLPDAQIGLSLGSSPEWKTNIYALRKKLSNRCKGITDLPTVALSVDKPLAYPRIESQCLKWLPNRVAQTLMKEARAHNGSKRGPNSVDAHRRSSAAHGYLNEPPELLIWV
jgi:hypothetical protein